MYGMMFDFDKTQSTTCLSGDTGNVIIPWKNTAS